MTVRSSRAQRPAVRGGHARRSRSVRRASAGLSPVRAGAALAMLASAAAIYGVAASPAFGFGHLALDGLRYTEEAAVRARLDVPDGTNLFALGTDDLAERLLELPTIARARVVVSLPDTLAVEIEERTPIVTWEIAERRYLADRDGTLFAELGDQPPQDAAALPVIHDRRAESRRLGVGSVLDPVDLDAATRLGAVAPSDVASGAPYIHWRITDAEGFVAAVPDGWTAVFGFYTPTLRTVEIIPEQVRLLGSLLLEQGERNVHKVVLASGTDGSFSTPTPAPAPSGGASP